MSHAPGPRSRRLVSFLRRRAAQAPARWKAMDEGLDRSLADPRAVVFTDTADFTKRTARHGIVHFLMLFQRILDGTPAAIRSHGGRLVKAEGDSLLLDFPDVSAACLGTIALDRMLRRTNKRLPAPDRLRFSYGIGYGSVLWLEHDLFGLEVNLASKLGEDLARPGEALLTPAAVAALSLELRRQCVAYRQVPYGGCQYEVMRLRLPR